jgi:transcriptional regulator with XRE-family HTH domain
LEGIEMKTLTQIACSNLKAACVEFDLSTRELAARANISQKSVWNLLNGAHSPRLDTLEAICNCLMVSPVAALTPNIDTGLLVSRRIPRLIESYTKLTYNQREQLEAIISQMVGDTP